MRAFVFRVLGAERAILRNWRSPDPPGHDPALTAKTCLAYLLAEPGVSSVVVGTINPDHLRDNVVAAKRAL